MQVEYIYNYNLIHFYSLRTVSRSRNRNSLNGERSERFIHVVSLLNIHRSYTSTIR